MSGMMPPYGGLDPWDDTRGVTPESRELLDQILKAAPDQRASRVEDIPAPWRAGFRRLLRGPDPEGALRLAARLPPRFVDSAPLPEWVSAMLHQGSYWARLFGLVISDHKCLDDLRRRPDQATLQATLARLTAERGIDEALGRIRTREYLRLAVRELEGAPLEEVGSDLSRLASVCIDAALASIDPTLPGQVAVFGMGKLGGEELNFLSDIDLIFVHEDAPNFDDSRHKTRLHGHLRQLVQILEGAGAWRPLFRVDMRLRPFGTRGPIVMSATATESYYERHGRPWERQAWIRARPVAGQRALGDSLLARLTPFVYRRNVSPAIFDEVSHLMLRARREAKHGFGAGAVDVKLDSGGIREVEFFVQALQLLHGGKIPALRTASTLEGLDRLLAHGLVADREHEHLVLGYRWLRRVEHRLQLVEGQQTHLIPEAAAERRQLALRLADANDAEGSDYADAFERELHAHRTQIAAIAQTLHGPSADAAVAEVERVRSRAQDAVLDPAARTEVRLDGLHQLGVRDPVDADAALQHLYSRRAGVFANRGASRVGAERLLLACLDSADPDTAVQRLVKFAVRHPPHHGIWRLFADTHPEALELVRLCAELLGSSEALSDGLVGFPGDEAVSKEDSLSLLLEARTLRSPPSEASLRHDLAEFVPDPRGTDATLLRFKQREIVRIALHDLGRRPDPLEVGRSLAALADPIIETIMAELGRSDDTSDTAAFDLAVFALGKYGMQAMDYGSDLDLMFVFAATEQRFDSSVQPQAIRMAQSLIARLQDRRHGPRLYQVDARLRPSGRQGLLVTSLEGFRRYHAHPLPVWERLALLWLRPVLEVRYPTGEPLPTDAPSIAQEIAHTIVPASLRAPLTVPAAGASPDPRAEVSRQVRTLIRRIADELSRETRTSYNAKIGYGGCLELEFLVSALVLLAPPDRPVGPVRGIVEALDRLRDTSMLTADEARSLGEIYRFQRLLLNRLRMTAGSRSDDPDRFSVNSPRLGALARRMGIADRDTLITSYLDYRSMVRDALDRHLPAIR